MANIVEINTQNGRLIRYIDEVIGSGAMKDVYFTEDKTQVVAFYRDKQDSNSRSRIKNITNDYYNNIFSSDEGDYWKKFFCWPTDVVESNGKLGVVLDVYPENYFFEVGSVNSDMLKIKGREKEGKWFSTPKNRFKFLESSERGSWLNYVQVCLKISRAVRRLHAAGLAHSDLSYKNILIDPTRGEACIIDIDGLVVPGKYPPDVVGTPDFIAPEVLSTSHLDKNDKGRCLPSMYTDRHALAVLIYQYLFLRHPLRGDKIHSDDPTEDESMLMGGKALFIEHSSDSSNKIDPANLPQIDQFWKNTSKLPYQASGPYLSELFERAFVDGLHTPKKRPTAAEWENALVKTIDLLQPCQNKKCEQEWYVFANTMKPKCPFCGTSYKGRLPILNLYFSHNGIDFRPENHRLMVYKDQSLFKWHVNRTISPNERLKLTDSSRIGYFTEHNNAWYLVNEHINDMYAHEGQTKTKIDKGKHVKLSSDMKISFGSSKDLRMFVVQMVENN